MCQELGPELSSHYLQLIVICQWRCIDLSHEISLLSQYQTNPRVGHLEVLYHLFVYLKNHLDIGWIAYDTLTPEIDESACQGGNCSEFYIDVQEEIPPKMQKARGNLVTISTFVDANHAGNVMTRWCSKRQNMVETATFDSEFAALRICKELIVAICYKLRMFGVLIDGPANVFCDAGWQMIQFVIRCCCHYWRQSFGVPGVEAQKFLKQAHELEVTGFQGNHPLLCFLCLLHVLCETNRPMIIVIHVGNIFSLRRELSIQSIITSKCIACCVLFKDRWPIHIGKIHLGSSFPAVVGLFCIFSGKQVVQAAILSSVSNTKRKVNSMPSQ